MAMEEGITEKKSEENGVQPCSAGKRSGGTSAGEMGR